MKHDPDHRVEQAIRDGILNWHALPCTTHTELMNRELFEYGLSLSAKLDARFGKQTIAAKMTDVPGHTVGMVPFMAKQGVRFLHLGVNPATPLPPVPPIFRWKNGDSEILVMYEGDYGQAAEFDDFILCFAHTGDNSGPQSGDQIREVYERIRQQYPGCRVMASTLNEAALRLLPHSSEYPVLEDEIGDTWIHGAGTDPLKVSRYRRVLRHLAEQGAGDTDLSDSLLLIPEHTWGMDVKTFFRNETDYTPEQMESKKEERKVIEKSWWEQREYAARAEQALGLLPEPSEPEPDLSSLTPLPLPSGFRYEISWQLFDKSDYERYKKEYLRSTVDWAIWDFTKVGLPVYQGGIFPAHLTGAYRKGDEKIYSLSFDKTLAEEQGLPRFYLKEKGGSVTILWYGKKASRLPQAFWFKIKGLEENWELDKMGTWIRADRVLGSPLIAAVGSGVRNPDCIIEPLDCPLAAPFGRRLLQYHVDAPSQNLYFNLYNNIWNTNFPMRYDDNARFRFVVRPC